jgi:peptidoglycan-N-acetylmuramic acid deacetylase
LRMHALYLIAGVAIILLLAVGCRQGAKAAPPVNQVTNSTRQEQVKPDIKKNTDNSTDTSTNTSTDVTKTPAASPVITKLDNTKYSWYLIRRSDHQPPETGAKLSSLVKQYHAIFLGNTSSKVVYLTFDEGYENGYTPQILDTLQANNVKAAFFITLPYLQKQPGLVQRMVNEGHIVGNHTVHHLSLPGVTDDQKLKDELVGVAAAFQAKTGLSMNYMRPPMGEFSARTLKITRDLDYRNVFWSFSYDDWDVTKQRGADYAYNMVMSNLHNGDVLLLHAVSKDDTQDLDHIIKSIKAQGYSFGPLNEIP